MVGVPGRSGGRNRKTTAEHKLNGSYRADRHDGRIDGVDAAGDPRKPDDLSPLQLSLWDAIVDHLPDGVVGVLDSASLTALVRWYGIYADLMSRVEQDPSDTKLMSQATKAWDRAQYRDDAEVLPTSDRRAPRSCVDYQAAIAPGCD